MPASGGGGGTSTGNSGMDPLTLALIGSAISGAFNLFGASKAAGAADRAAQLQANAANQAGQLSFLSSMNALDFARQMYEQQRSDQAPWLNAGRWAVGTLASRMGAPASAGATMGPAQTLARTSNATGADMLSRYLASTGQSGNKQIRESSKRTGDFAIPRAEATARSLSSVGAPTTAPPSATASTFTGASAIGGKVKMRAPTGEVSLVDPSLVQHYLDQGAQVVA